MTLTQAIEFACNYRGPIFIALQRQVQAALRARFPAIFNVLDKVAK